ncbi:hypothetical protein ACOME3_002987 [Neoechinorhynchus agilis]
MQRIRCCSPIRLMQLPRPLVMMVTAGRRSLHKVSKNRPYRRGNQSNSMNSQVSSDEPIRALSVSFDPSFANSQEAENERHQYIQAIVHRMTHADQPRPKNLRGKDIGLHFARNARSKKDRVHDVLIHAFEVPNLFERVSTFTQNPADLPRRLAEIASRPLRFGDQVNEHSVSQVKYPALRNSDKYNQLLFDQFEESLKRRKLEAHRNAGSNRKVVRHNNDLILFFLF